MAPKNEPSPQAAKIRVNKSEAARRQVDAGIRIHFAGEDPVAVHTVASAAWRILRDLSRRSGRPGNIVEQLESVIRPEMRSEFWRQINAPANFLKHADRDADVILDYVGETINDVTLHMCCHSYQDLGFQLTKEMVVFISWSYALYPHLLLEGPLRDTAERVPMLRELGRAEQLQVGRDLLQLSNNIVETERFRS